MDGEDGESDEDWKERFEGGEKSKVWGTGNGEIYSNNVLDAVRNME